MNGAGSKINNIVNFMFDLNYITHFLFKCIKIKLILIHKKKIIVKFYLTTYGKF